MDLANFMGIKLNDIEELSKVLNEKGDTTPSQGISNAIYR